MARRLPGDAAHQFRTTDHSDEITYLRQRAEQHDRLRSMALIYLVAAELLEAHDSTGISLDEWDAPREFVEMLIHGPILLNNV